MLFQTREFLVLCTLIFIGIGLLRRARDQQLLLLVGSYVFYGWWDVRFLMLLLLSSLVDYIAALAIEGEQVKWRKRWQLSLLLFTGSALFLGINWPALQWSSEPIRLETLFRPEWTGAPLALAACGGLAVVWPFVYESFFHLQDRTRRRVFLVTSLCANLGILGFFKYFNFFRDNMVGVGSLLGFEWSPPALSVILPVGISFYTFQTMSYTIDVYRKQFVAERSFLRMALFVAYFPQLVAGPIIRPQQFLPTLHRPWWFTSENVISGFNLVLVGLVKKVLIADSLAPTVDRIFSSTQGRPSVQIVLGSLLFAVQIYCDFSGYTDIARGVSRMMGVHIPLNFDLPYFSTSIVEFWRRWHISLSSWLRDYLYIPLGGNRSGAMQTLGNLMTTMVLGGLWHGASWNFAIWGFYQGVLLCVNREFSAITERRPRASRWLATRGARLLCWCVTMYFVLLGWLIFRLEGLSDVLYAVKKFVVFDGRMDFSGMGLSTDDAMIGLMALTAFIVVHTVSFFRRPWPDILDRMPRPALLLTYTIIGGLLFFGWPRHETAFIYFEF